MKKQLIVMLMLGAAFLTGCRGEAKSDGKVIEDTSPAGAPSAQVAESSPGNAALIECGYPDQDCASVNLDLLKKKGKLRSKSEATASSEKKALNCSGGKAKPNGDGTLNLCDCACVPESQIAKNAP